MAEQESVSLDDVQVQLPPIFEQALAQMKGDRRKLMKDKAYESPAQLRAFLGTHHMARSEEVVRLLASAMMDIYQMVGANASEIRRLHTFTVDELNSLGADLDHDRLPGVSPDLMDDFQQAFYGLGSVLKKKLPEDTEAQEAYNLCATYLAEVVNELMHGRSENDDDENDDDDDENDDDDSDENDSDSEAPAEPTAEPTAESPKVDEEQIGE